MKANQTTSDQTVSGPRMNWAASRIQRITFCVFSICLIAFAATTPQTQAAMPLLYKMGFNQGRAEALASSPIPGGVDSGMAADGSSLLVYWAHDQPGAEFVRGEVTHLGGGAFPVGPLDHGQGIIAGVYPDRDSSPLHIRPLEIKLSSQFNAKVIFPGMPPDPGFAPMFAPGSNRAVFRIRLTLRGRVGWPNPDPTLPPEWEDLETQTVTFAVRKPLIVLLHGIQSDKTTFTEDFLKPLREGDGSDWVLPLTYPPDEPNWPDQFAAAVAVVQREVISPTALVRKNWAIKRFFLVGHSQGGVLAVAMCSSRSSGTPFPNQDIMNQVFGLVTIGSPLVGSRVAGWGLRYQRVGIGDLLTYPPSAPPTVAAPNTLFTYLAHYWLGAYKFDPWNPDAPWSQPNALVPPATFLSSRIDGGLAYPGYPQDFLTRQFHSLLGINPDNAAFIKSGGYDGIVDYLSQGGGIQPDETISDHMAHASIVPGVHEGTQTASQAMGERVLAAYLDSSKGAFNKRVVAPTMSDLDAMQRRLLQSVIDDFELPSLVQLGGFQGIKINLRNSVTGQGVTPTTVDAYRFDGLIPVSLPAQITGSEVVVDITNLTNADVVVSAAGGPNEAAPPRRIWSIPALSALTGLSCNPTSVSSIYAGSFRPSFTGSFGPMSRTLILNRDDVSVAVAGSGIVFNGDDIVVSTGAVGTVTYTVGPVSTMVSIQPVAVPDLPIVSLRTTVFARAGDPVVLSSIAQGGTVTNYAWRQGGSSNVLGTSDELVIPVATNAHVGTYTLSVQGPGGSNSAFSRLVFDAPFAAWRSSYPEHWSSSTPPAVDPLGGSNILLFRYAVGMTPGLEFKRRPRGGFAKIGGSSYLTLTFPQRYRPAADLVLTIEASTNLVTWQAIAAPEVSSQPLDGAFRQVMVRDVLPVGTGQRFLRLRVALVSL